MEGGGPVIVARVSEAEVVALLDVCTHSGCPVQYRLAEADFLCNCHGARFSEHGDVLQGPAQLPLQRYPASFDSQAITVGSTPL